MLVIVTVLLFVSVAVGTAFLAVRFAARRGRAVARVSTAPQPAAPVLPSRALIWRELVGWAGSMVPSSPKNAPRLRLRLIRAGFRQPGAVSTFNGIRVCGTSVLTGAALFFGIRSYTTLNHLLMLTGGAAFAGWQLPMMILKIRLKRRQRDIERALPNALDLLVVCVEAGLGMDQAIIQVAKELRSGYPAICEEFTMLNLEMRAGKRRPEALHNLAERTGVDDLKKLVAVLVQTDRFGTSIAASLRGHADYMRTIARQRAEERAAKLAVKLVFPIFFCVLPALFVVTIGPVMVTLVRDLLPMVENM